MLAVQTLTHWQVSLCGPIILKGNSIFVVYDFCGQLSMKGALGKPPVVLEAIA